MVKILVIDDIAGVRTIIHEMLERNGYEVIEASNGKEGMQMVEQYEPDAVVTDILMQEMDGLETIKCMTKSRPKLPIVALTASYNKTELHSALKYGAICGLYKPFNQVELLSAVWKALERRELKKA